MCLPSQYASLFRVMQLSEVDRAVWQALVGTLFTWGMTAAGAALVFVLEGGQVIHCYISIHYFK